MQVKSITSSSNPLLKKIRRLDDSNDRKELDLLLIEGPKLITEAIRKGLQLVDVVVSKSFFSKELDQTALPEVDELTLVDDKTFASLCTTASSCGILATAKIKKHSLPEILQKKSGVIAFAECIQDPGNLGTMIRIALAFEAVGLVLSKGSVDYSSPKVVRASMGAVFSLPIVDEQDVAQTLSQFKSNKIPIVALDAKGKKMLGSESWSKQVVYIFGNEGHGLSPEALEYADETVAIAISPESESLNVAVTMGIVLYQASLKLSGRGLTSR